MDRRAYHTLYAMRGVAALAVVTLHAQMVAGLPARLLPGAYLAVDLFFVLSDFVLEHAYGPRLAGAMRARQFVAARYARLYPLFALGFAIGAVIALAALVLGGGELSGGGLALAFLSGALLLPSPTWTQTVLFFPVNVPAWSLVYELFVNVLFAAVWKRLTIAVLTVIVAVSGIALIGAVLATGHVDVGSIWPTAPAGVPRVIFSFFAGVLLRRLHRGARRESAIGWVLPFALLPVFAYAPSPGLRPFTDLAFVLFLFPAAVATGAAFEPGRIGVPAFRYLGLVSYPIYAIHYPVFELLRRALHILRSPVPYPIVAVAVGLGLVAVSGLLARWYDEPVRRIIAPRRARG